MSKLKELVQQHCPDGVLYKKLKDVSVMQRGTSIVNINYQDICQLEVPTPSIDDQKEIANEYNKGLKVYKQIIDEATDAWNKVKNNVQSRLY